MTVSKKTRVCATCIKEKSLESFPQHKPGHHRRVCRACFNDRRDEHGLKPDVDCARVTYTDKVEKEKLTHVEEHRLKIDNRNLRSQNEKLIKELSEGGEYNQLVGEVIAMQAGMKIPKIVPREQKSGLLEATPLVLASDWHVDEVVEAKKVAGRNRYDQHIAKQRMRRFFESILWSVKHQRDVFKIRSLILWLGGDLMTNFLHEDDVENNSMQPLLAIPFLFENIVAGIDLLLTDKEIAEYVIPCNDGNHGRTTKKLRAATRTEHSLEVLLYAMLAQHYRDEKRVRFILPTSQFTFLDDIYGRTIRFFHGDVVQYGGGVGGITVPLFRAVSRFEKTKRADLTCLGHFHQRYCLPDIMVNGSMIGYNAYAMSKGLPFEAPVQSLRMLEPTRWCSIDIPLWISSKDDDINNRKAA
jgi:hypothetical protein